MKEKNGEELQVVGIGLVIKLLLPDVVGRLPYIFLWINWLEEFVIIVIVLIGNEIYFVSSERKENRHLMVTIL